MSHRLLLFSLCLLCLAPVKPPLEPIKGATKLMLDAKASKPVSGPMPLVAPPATNRYPLTITWDKSVSTNVAGYRLYVGNASRNYTNLVDAGNSNTNSISVLDGVTYYLAATAYDSVGLESVYSEELVYPTFVPLMTNYVMVSLDYFSVSLNQWVTNYASRTYTNPAGIGFFRYRSGDVLNSPNANNRAWQTAVSAQGPYFDIPDTLVQGTNVGPIRFQITNWWTQ